MTKLTDKLLIQTLLDYLDEHKVQCEYLLCGKTNQDIDRLRELAKDKREHCLTVEAPEFVQGLWKHLITDAINVLKYHDTREVPVNDKPNYQDWLEKTFKSVAFGMDDLDRYFHQFIEFEQMLYGAERYYRDHFPHVLRVWLIGMLIMTAPRYLEAEQLHIETPKDAAFIITVPERIAIWTLIALCHDLGYPLQKIGSINTPLRKMLDNVGRAQVQDFTYEFPRQHQFIDDFIMRFISSRLCIVPKPNIRAGIKSKTRQKFKSEIQTKYYLKLSKSFEELQHGILSCTLLMKRLVYFLESDFDISALKTLDEEDARQFTIRREVLRAIATHTCSDIYHLRCDVLSFLLIVCDDMQEWDRPTFHQMRGLTQRPTEVDLENYSASQVAVSVTYPAPQGMELVDFAKEKNGYVRSIFRRLHKILRSAVYASARSFSCQWKVRLVTHDRKKHLDLVFQHQKNEASLRIGSEIDTKWLYDENVNLQDFII